MRRLAERMGLKRSAFMLFGGLTCLAGGGVASALFWGVPTVIILLIAIVCKNKGV